jgi:Ca-activated chloride channel family protein
MRPWAAPFVVAFLLVAAAIIGSGPALAQSPKSPPALLLIMDASGSMNADDGSGHTKIDAAKDALRALVDKLPKGAPVGLRVYGHRVPNTDKANGCRDSQLVMPVGPLDPDAMKAAIGSYQAKGYTPIGFSLQEGARDLPPEGERTIILVSDGEDTCAPPDPCEVAKGLKAQGIGLKIETVGFQVDPAARAQLQCIATATGGAYRDAPNAAELATGLQQISGRALREYQAHGTPVKGGAAFRDAPIVGPGLYTDTLLGAEVLWYGVNLQVDQELVVRATLVGSPGEEGRAGRFLAVFVTPDLQNFYTRTESKFGDIGKETLSVANRTGVVSQNPGTWYLRIFKAVGEVKRPLPLEIEIQVLGPGSAASTNSTTVSGSATTATWATTQRAALKQAKADRGRGTGLWAFVVVAVAAALLGVGGTAVVLRRAGSKNAHPGVTS